MYITSSNEGVKLELSGKLEEDPEAYICRTINWMNTHNFAAVQ